MMIFFLSLSVIWCRSQVQNVIVSDCAVLCSSGGDLLSCWWSESDNAAWVCSTCRVLFLTQKLMFAQRFCSLYALYPLLSIPLCVCSCMHIVYIHVIYIHIHRQMRLIFFCVFSNEWCKCMEHLSFLCSHLLLLSMWKSKQGSSSHCDVEKPKKTLLKWKKIIDHFLDGTGVCERKKCAMMPPTPWCLHHE